MTNESTAGLPVPDELLERLADLVADKLAARFEPPKQWPEWMNIETASAYLDCSPERLRKLKERGQVPFVQDGTQARVFFEREALDHWMRSQTKEDR